jgi:hypothetical protein
MSTWYQAILCYCLPKLSNLLRLPSPEDTTCHNPLKSNPFTQSLLPFPRESERIRWRVIIILWTLLTKYQTITFIMNTCDQLPVEFNKEQTSVPWTSVEFPKAMGSLGHTHSWYKYVCLYICIYEIAEKPPQTVSVSVKKRQISVVITLWVSLIEYQTITFMIDCSH